MTSHRNNRERRASNWYRFKAVQTSILLVPYLLYRTALVPSTVINLYTALAIPAIELTYNRIPLYGFQQWQVMFSAQSIYRIVLLGCSSILFFLCEILCSCLIVHSYVFMYFQVV